MKFIGKMFTCILRTVCSFLLTIILGIPACIMLLLAFFIMAVRGMKKEEIKQILVDVMSKY